MVRRCGCRCWSRPAPATSPLRGQQARGPQQPQHPLAADVPAVLAASPGPELAVALAGERRVSPHLADQPQSGLLRGLALLRLWRLKSRGSTGVLPSDPTTTPAGP